jgi:hypothetical protein
MTSNLRRPRHKVAPICISTHVIQDAFSFTKVTSLHYNYFRTFVGHNCLGVSSRTGALSVFIWHTAALTWTLQDSYQPPPTPPTPTSDNPYSASRWTAESTNCMQDIHFDGYDRAFSLVTLLILRQWQSEWPGLDGYRSQLPLHLYWFNYILVQVKKRITGHLLTITPASGLVVWPHFTESQSPSFNSSRVRYLHGHSHSPYNIDHTEITASNRTQVIVFTNSMQPPLPLYSNPTRVSKKGPTTTNRKGKHK